MGNVNMEASQINYRGGEKKMSVEEALKNTSGEAAAIAQLQTDVINLNSNKANQITIAPFFNAETAYDPGDIVYYNGLSYRCVNAHEGEWDADDFAATTIDNELSSLNSNLTNLNDKLVSAQIPYDGTDNIFPVSVRPKMGYQIAQGARNVATGALYLLWYDDSANGFRIGNVLEGNAPSDGDNIVVQYFA